MALQIIALVLAFAIRKVKVKGLDDTKFIVVTIYVTSIVLALIILAIYSLKGVINGFAALFCTGFLVGTTVILGLVFVPLVRKSAKPLINIITCMQCIYHIHVANQAYEHTYIARAFRYC